MCEYGYRLVLPDIIQHQCLCLDFFFLQQMAEVGWGPTRKIQDYFYTIGKTSQKEVMGNASCVVARKLHTLCGYVVTKNIAQFDFLLFKIIAKCCL